MIKRTLLFFLVISICTTLFSFVNDDDTFNRIPQKKVRTIIVDAGHGIMENGGHNGARGAYSHEDEICLDISKELVKVLRNSYPDIKVIETRPTERIVPLHRRAEIANENRGDLFICIHVNAAVAIRHSERTGYRTVVSYVGKGKKRKKGNKESSQIPVLDNAESR